MRTIDYLFDPALSSLYIPGVLTGIAIAIMCSPLSVLVVLKRLSFIGQGISHAAFGGVGIAAILGVTGFTLAQAELQLVIVLAFCLAAAMGIAAMSNRRSTSADTAIGIVLVGSMALGAILIHLAFIRQRTAGPSWESILFGSILNVGRTDAVIAWGVTAAVLFTLWLVRRPLVFWAFDEPASPAFGVRGGAMKVLLLTLLCLAIVTSMKLAGVVLATAILVLPGAAALTLCARWTPALVASLVFSVTGVLGGLIASFEFDTPPGPTIVATLAVLYAGARLVSMLSRRAAVA